MGYIQEKQNLINEMDTLIYNYVKSAQEEYPDKLLKYEVRWDVFFALSSLRRYELLFFPFENNSTCCVFGDKYGSLAGILCEKCNLVDYIAETITIKELLALRYRGHYNFNIFNSLENDMHDHSYDYAVVNLEYNDDYSLQNAYNFDNLIKPALEILKDSGTLLISVRAYKYYEVIRLLSFLGNFKITYHDPYHNGLYVVEVVRNNQLKNVSLFDWSEYKKNGLYRSPLLDDKWCIKNSFPNWSAQSKDQDYDNIKLVKAVQLDLLAKLTEVCKRNNLKLYPIFGTLLGLMRGGQYIDGDDDIDVALMRSDYDKLVKLSSEFTGKYFLQTPESDDYFSGGFIKLRNVETTAIHPQNWWANCCEGIGIDIFPIDKVFTAKRKETSRLKKIRFYQRMLYAYSYGYFKDFKDMKMLKWKFFKYLGKLTKRQGILDKFNNTLKSGDSKENLAIYTNYSNGNFMPAAIFKADYFKSSFVMQYEGIPLNVPCGWHSMLCERYGDGAFNILPYNEFKTRHGFYDVKTPYPVWKERFGGLKHPAGIKEPVVLFGDGSLFEPCLEYYKSRVNISHLVLLPEEESSLSKVMGVPVISFDEFEKLNLSKDSYRGIICSGDALLADSILSEKGYPGLYIFWHDRNWMLFANQSAVWKCIKSLE